MMNFTKTMLLKNLIKTLSKNHKNLEVKGLTANSNDVKKGYIFIAIKGTKINGEHFINDAIKKGAIAIICSQDCKYSNKKILVIKTKNIRKYLSKLSSKFYNLKPKNIIAVTGTNGKTSVADFFYQILSLNRVPVASIGTLGIKYKKKTIKTQLTTPDTVTLHKNLENLKNNKIDNVIIEASSHALHQNRLNDINFKAGIFTNFSQDHLDYHRTMKAYLNAKLVLFSQLLSKKKHLITDEKIKEYSILKKISKIKKLKLLNISKKMTELNNISNLKGSFQLKNLSMAALAAKLCGLNKKKINLAIKSIKNVDGRLEFVKKFNNNVKVFLDYAHTPGALQAALQSFKSPNNNNISLVFGCGGERDKKKRSIMAKIAKAHCKKIYVTDDNPRYENPNKIRNEICKHLKGITYFNIASRSEAIKRSIFNAEPNEIILIAGKGHETYQDYGKKIIFISDKKIIKNIKKSQSKIKKSSLTNSKIIQQVLRKNKIYKYNGLAIDSRDVKKENIFLAIKGKNNDGNKFIPQAVKRGAKLIVSSKNNKKFKKKIIKVEDEFKFLNKFAFFNRKNSNAKIIAVTGSAGKTSLKNLLKNLLNNFGSTFASPKSFNNSIGVPVSLSNLNINHKFGVFEVGMSKSGEIDHLTKKIKPNLGIITNIGEAHIENFKNIKGIASAKAEIINNIEENGSIILNRDDKFFNFLYRKAKSKKIKVITFGKNNKSDVQFLKQKKNNGANLIHVRVNDKIVKFKIKDINLYNVLCSLAVINEFGLSIDKIVKTYENFEPTEGRGKIHKISRYKKKFKLIDESYNANPLSVKNALRNFSEIKKKKFKKYLLLGDMLELGKKSEIYHKNLSKLINSSDIDKVFIKGEKTLFTYKNINKNKRGNIFQCDQDIDLIFKNIITNNDYLMIKGSNSTGLKHISNAMIKES